MNDGPENHMTTREDKPTTAEWRTKAFETKVKLAAFSRLSVNLEDLFSDAYRFKINAEYCGDFHQYILGEIIKAERELEEANSKAEL